MDQTSPRGDAAASRNLDCVPYRLAGRVAVIAATDEADTNRSVAEAADARRIWANVVDDAPLCSFQVPARIERGPLQIAISSGGGAPMLARHLRERLETDLDESLGTLGTLLVRHRRRIRAQIPDTGRGGVFLMR